MLIYRASPTSYIAMVALRTSPATTPATRTATALVKRCVFLSCSLNSKNVVSEIKLIVKVNIIIVKVSK